MQFHLHRFEKYFLIKTFPINEFKMMTMRYIKWTLLQWKFGLKEKIENVEVRRKIHTRKMAKNLFIQN